MPATVRFVLHRMLSGCSPSILANILVFSYSFPTDVVVSILSYSRGNPRKTSGTTESTAIVTSLVSYLVVCDASTDPQPRFAVVETVDQLPGSRILLSGGWLWL